DSHSKFKVESSKFKSGGGAKGGGSRGRSLRDRRGTPAACAAGVASGGSVAAEVLLEGFQPLLQLGLHGRAGGELDRLLLGFDGLLLLASVPVDAGEGIEDRRVLVIGQLGSALGCRQGEVEI